MRQRETFWSSEFTWRFAEPGSSPAPARDYEVQGRLPIREPRNRVVQVRRFGSPDGLEVVDAPLPTADGGEVRVRVLASGLEYTDALIRRRLYPQTMRRRPPFVMGYDVVGEIDQLGDGVSGFQLGDRVADMTVVGSNAAYRTLRADRLARVPAGLDAAEVATLTLSWTTAYQLLHRSGRASPSASPLMRSPRRTAVSRRAGSTASSSCARTFRRAVTGCRLRARRVPLLPGPRPRPKWPAPTAHCLAGVQHMAFDDHEDHQQNWNNTNDCAFSKRKPITHIALRLFSDMLEIGLRTL
jgi:hypothetical protein